MMHTRHSWNKYLPLLPREAPACKDVCAARLRSQWKGGSAGYGWCIAPPKQPCLRHSTLLHGGLCVAPLEALSPLPLCSWNLLKIYVPGGYTNSFPCATECLETSSKRSSDLNSLSSFLFLVSRRCRGSLRSRWKSPCLPALLFLPCQ